MVTTLRRKLKGKNISAIARDIGVSSSLLHDWVQGRRLPSMKNIHHVKALAEHIGLTLEELLFGVSSDEKKNERVITQLTFDDGDRSYKINILRNETKKR